MTHCLLTVSKLKYIVAGTGRCGTVYLAKLLSSLGLPCTHEAIFQHDGIDNAIGRLDKPLEVSVISQLASEAEERNGIYWFKNGDIVAEASYMAAPYLQHSCLNNVTVIHLIREPMKVINSFVEGFEYFHDDCLEKPDYKEYHEFIYSFIPRLHDKTLTPADRAALYWCEWNEMIERLSKDKPYYRCRIEQTPNNIFKFLNIKADEYYNNKEVNHKQDVRDTYTRYEQIPCKEIRDRLVALRNRYYSILMG